MTLRCWKKESSNRSGNLSANCAQQLLDGAIFDGCSITEHLSSHAWRTTRNMQEEFLDRQDPLSSAEGKRLKHVNYMFLRIELH